MLNKNGTDWLGFHKNKGTGHQGEYRGFPNAIHKQDGSFFHAMNASTLPSSSEITVQTSEQIQIVFTSNNGKWKGVWDFYSDRLDFTMSEVSDGYHYWVQYEGAPGGTMDNTDFRLSSADPHQYPITEHYVGDLPAPEWMAFGDINQTRVLFMLHHQDDLHPDNYEDREFMTVFGRSGKNKFLDKPNKFSIGFIESTEHAEISKSLNELVQ